MSSSAGTSGGSPPHTRGRCGFTVDFNPNQRFTPAYAGKIVSWREGVPCREVHPRIRGEDCCLPGWFLSGFTPAYAGKIPFTTTWNSTLQVHPRIRGEDQVQECWQNKDEGSPPHTRGRSSSFTGSPPNGWFTPAYAGKMWLKSKKCTHRKVHPRIRGEDRLYQRVLYRQKGSPPHTRGRFDYVSGRDKPLGFTPAYAGKIVIPPLNISLPKVHPRIRGEDGDARSCDNLDGGSPPHTRGRYIGFSRISGLSGFTPAYAGKIFQGQAECPRVQVHPRIRGEDSRLASVSEWSIGSPPHTRGRFYYLLTFRREKGFTPAYAGKIRRERG